MTGSWRTVAFSQIADDVDVDVDSDAVDAVDAVAYVAYVIFVANVAGTRLAT